MKAKSTKFLPKRKPSNDEEACATSSSCGCEQAVLSRVGNIFSRLQKLNLRLTRIDDELSRIPGDDCTQHEPPDSFTCYLAYIQDEIDHLESTVASIEVKFDGNNQYQDDTGCGDGSEDCE